MRLKNILFILLGIAIAVFAVALYKTVWHKSTSNNTDNILHLSDEFSKQRANAIVLAANKVAPCVVSISVVQTKVVSTSPFFSPFSDETFREFFKDFFPERYHRQQVKSLGSGVVVSPDGYILTTEHVVSNATDINITLPDSQQLKGTIVTSDKTRDLALVKVDAKDLPYAELGDSDNLMIGEWVIAFGNPFGFLLEDIKPTVTVGVVSALNRSIKSTRDDRIYKNMIQTDAAINPGNSGGPLVNILGQVIGINNFIFTSGGGSEGIGFARPINIVKKFIEEAKKFGRIRQSWIGWWLQNVTRDVVEQSGVPMRGAMVTNVDAKSPAEKAGVKKDDLIISVNDRKIHRVADWDRFAANVFVDDELSIILLRDKDPIEIVLVVEELKTSGGVSTETGIYVEDINAELAKKFNLGYKDGVVVRKVQRHSIGERIGVVPGDVILKIGDKRIMDKADFQEALKSSRDIYFIVDRGGLIIQFYFGL